MPKILLKNILFCLFLLILSNLVAMSAKAADSSEDEIYTVEDVAVNVQSNSPANARSLAMATARKDAFLILLVRLGVDINFANKVTADEITDLVRSEQVFDEKILANNYIATFKITFAKDFVEHLFAKKNSLITIKNKDEKLSFLLIPAFVLQQKILIWESGNNWKKAVAGAIKSQKIDNFKLSEADIDNLAILNEENIKNIKIAEIEPFFSKYKVDIIYIPFFSYDAQIKKASVLVKGFERMRQFQYRISFINSGDLNDEQLLNKVAFKMVEYLAQLKAKDIQDQKNASSLVKLYIPVQKFGDWLLIKNIIESSGFAAKINVEGISRDYVNVSMLYNSNEDIVAAFDRVGLELIEKAENYYLVLRK